MNQCPATRNGSECSRPEHSDNAHDFPMAAYIAPTLGTYIIQVEVTEIAYPSNGPDSFSATAEILADYARELSASIDAGYHGRLKTGRIAVGVPDNPTQPVR